MLAQCKLMGTRRVLSALLSLCGDMMTRVRFPDAVEVERPVLTVELELPHGFHALPLVDQRALVETQLTRAHETALRILDRRAVA